MSDAGVVLFDSWHAYPHVYALGHNAIAELLFDPVTVSEKADGSQCSMGRFPPTEAHPDGLRIRSKGAELNIIAPEKMFAPGVEAIKSLDLHVGWTYRCEYLRTPKHNTLTYSRIPDKHLILFDVNTGHEAYLSYDEMVVEAARIGLEVVPLLYQGMLTDLSLLRDLLDRTSMLGGTKIEGVVIKNVTRFGPDGKVLMGKFVPEAFKEVHAHEWKQANPTSKDIVDRLIEQYRTPARWQKAAQHLRDRGELEQSPRDIGKLIPEIQADVAQECEMDIKDILYRWAWPHLKRGIVAGAPVWYKEELLKLQFDASDSAGTQIAGTPGQ